MNGKVAILMLATIDEMSAVATALCGGLTALSIWACGSEVSKWESE